MGCANSSAAADGQAESCGRRSDRSSARITPFTEGSVSELSFLGKLGQGSCATVHRARSSKLGDKVVAVKVADLREAGAEEWDAEQLSKPQLRTMQEEVAAMTRVNESANVIDFYGSFRAGCLFFFVMEQCDRSLHQAMDRLPGITEATVCRMLKEMLNGLASVHAVDIVHRDVKPDNFLCTGPKDTVKLCDFGFAALLPPQGDGLTGCFGTPPFMSPEMLLNKPYDQQTDTWSFGVIVYSLFFGRFPYEPTQRTGKAMREAIRSGIPVPSFRPLATLMSAQKVSDGAKQLATNLLNQNPDQRISAEGALGLQFFSRPGNTNLFPMLDSARAFGAFCTVSCHDPSLKNEVDRRIESLQRQPEETRSVQVRKAAHDDEASTYAASDFSPGVHSRVDTSLSHADTSAASLGLQSHTSSLPGDGEVIANGTGKD